MKILISEQTHNLTGFFFKGITYVDDACLINVALFVENYASKTVCLITVTELPLNIRYGFLQPYIFNY